ncbi:unnamed protein product [Orchesella dallaii]|uniref:Uncharacterized protein n=1 Tax=Orchesella dallaii TaxID=48710 RepID=A0ABP1Q9N9_9HEXA
MRLLLLLLLLQLVNCSVVEEVDDDTVDYTVDDNLQFLFGGLTFDESKMSAEDDNKLTYNDKSGDIPPEVIKQNILAFESALKFDESKISEEDDTQSDDNGKFNYSLILKPIKLSFSPKISLFP